MGVFARGGVIPTITWLLMGFAIEIIALTASTSSNAYKSPAYAVQYRWSPSLSRDA